MKRLNSILFLLLTVATLSTATTVYEDAEDGTTDGWRVQTDSNEPTNAYSPSTDSRVIRLAGGGGPWILGAVSGDLAWNNTTEKTITWSMYMGDRYTVYIPVTTTHGTRYLFYNDLPKRILRHGVQGGILHGLGGYRHAEYKHVWRTYTRDLEADLKDSEPDNELISVNGFIYSGADVSLDNIMLYNPEETVYENGSRAVNWRVSDNDPAGVTVVTVIDPQGDHVQGDVIQLQGSGLNNAYRLNQNSWNNTTQSIIQWKSRFFETYSVSINVQTTQGARELLYTNSNNYTPSGGIINNGATIWHEMGGRSLMGQNGWEQRRDFGDVNYFWQTVTRDLKQDIRDFEPNNELISVNSFEVMGSGLIDDVKMLGRAVIPNPNNDMIYEDAEDDNTNGWHVYDETPAGATISNVYDATRGSRVIELSGSGLSNGYEIGRRRGGGRWDNRNHKAISWSMNYSEAFAVYVAIETTDGARYMKYQPVDSDGGKSGNYILFGLGADADNGTWQTFDRNIEEDLHQFEPDNELIAIHAFLIRGSGRIDDIKTMMVHSPIVYEDAEDGNIDGWSIYENNSGNAVITNVEDATRGSRVIELSGQGRADGYMLGAIWGDNRWSNENHKRIKWSMNYNESFRIYISVRTTNGHRYIRYSPVDGNEGLSGEYIRIGLGANADDGTWRTFERNLAQDISDAEAGNELLYIDAFMIRGSGRLDDIITF